jgi:phosphoglycolate phosphatase-like HAD superfamily hydrolase
MGQSPEDVLYVGDTETDLLCARNAGTDCAYIHHGNPEPKLVEVYQPVIMLAALSGLEKAI